MYRRLAGSLLVFFQRRVHDAELATDLTADTFTVALERRDQYRGASDDELATLLEKTERYCVVLQTLTASPELSVSLERG